MVSIRTRTKRKSHPLNEHSSAGRRPEVRSHTRLHTRKLDNIQRRSAHRCAMQPKISQAAFWRRSAAAAAALETYHSDMTSILASKMGARVNLRQAHHKTTQHHNTQLHTQDCHHSKITTTTKSATKPLTAARRRCLIKHIDFANTNMSLRLVCASIALLIASTCIVMGDARRVTRSDVVQIGEEQSQQQQIDVSPTALSELWLKMRQRYPSLTQHLLTELRQRIEPNNLKHKAVLRALDDAESVAGNKLLERAANSNAAAQSPWMSRVIANPVYARIMKHFQRMRQITPTSSTSTSSSTGRANHQEAKYTQPSRPLQTLAATQSAGAGRHVYGTLAHYPHEIAQSGGGSTSRTLEKLHALKQEQAKLEQQEEQLQLQQSDSQHYRQNHGEISFPFASERAVDTSNGARAMGDVADNRIDSDRLASEAWPADASSYRHRQTNQRRLSAPQQGALAAQNSIAGDELYAQRHSMESAAADADSDSDAISSVGSNGLVNNFEGQFHSAPLDNIGVRVLRTDNRQTDKRQERQQVSTGSPNEFYVD